MNKYIVEFIGTFFLVLTVGLAAVLGHAGAHAGLAIGSCLMVMIFAGGHISGGHFNPAVTLAVWIRGKCSTVDAIPYIIAQVLAGAAAAALVAYVLINSAPAAADGTPFAGITQLENLDMVSVLIVEFLFTFALAWVVLNSATAKGTDGNSFYGLAIGFTVVVGAYAAGGISGGAFNPAVATGLLVMGKLGADQVWMHIAANLVGGLVAGIAFKALVKDQS